MVHEVLQDELQSGVHALSILVIQYIYIYSGKILRGNFNNDYIII